MARRVQHVEQSGASEVLRPVITSVIVGIVVSIIFLLLMSVVLATQNIPQRAIGPMSTFAVSAGAFAAGFACAKIMRKGGLAYGAVSGAALCLIAMLASLTISDGGFGMVALFKLIFMLLSGMLGGVFGVNVKRPRKRV